MRPLIDADILLHEIGWSSQFKDRQTGEDILLDWPIVQELVDNKIELICKEVGATLPPILFMTDCPFLIEQDNRLNRLLDKPLVESVPNFRIEVAKTKPYKGTRKSDKPYHFYNLMVYLAMAYDCRVAYGSEADDLMGCYEPDPISDEVVVYCSRDKDIRQFPGFHYSWECGKQKAIGPVYTSGFGWLELKNDDGDVIGYGDKFLYYQWLIGDSVDNIPGCPGVGKVKAYELLKDVTDFEEMKNICVETYKKALGDDWLEYGQEQWDLVYIHRRSLDGPT